MLLWSTSTIYCISNEIPLDLDVPDRLFISFLSRLDSRGIVKIGDFGVSHFFDNDEGIEFHHDPDVHDSKILSRYDSDTAFSMKKLSNAGMLNKTEGTWCFWSPQMCSGETFSGFAADMWAAGICLYIFVSGKLPFYSEVPTELFKSIQDDDVPLEGMGFSDSLLDLLNATLNKDADERAGVGDCLRHPFLSEAREQRVKQLSVAFDKCRKRNLIVNEDDIRKVSLFWWIPLKLNESTHSSFVAGFPSCYVAQSC